MPYTFTTKQDNVDDVLASHMNGVQDAITDIASATYSVATYGSIAATMAALPDEGGTIVIPPGTYTEDVEITKHGVTLQGSGNRATTIEGDITWDVTLVDGEYADPSDPTAPYPTFTTLRDFKLVGSVVVAGELPFQFEMARVRVDNTDNAGAYAIDCVADNGGDTGQHWYLEHCEFRNSGLKLRGINTTTLVECDVRWSSQAYGVWLERPGDDNATGSCTLKMFGGSIQGCDNVGLYLGPGANSCEFVGVHFEGNADGDVVFADFTIVGGWVGFVNCKFNGDGETANFHFGAGTTYQPPVNLTRCFFVNVPSLGEHIQLGGFNGLSVTETRFQGSRAQAFDVPDQVDYTRNNTYSGVMERYIRLRDTTLYRTSADVLKTDDTMRAATLTSEAWVTAFDGNAAKVSLGAGGPGGEAGIQWGSLADTNLYRSAADNLKTDDSLTVAALASGAWVTAFNGQAAKVTLGALGPSSESGVALGSLADTLLYRKAAALFKIHPIELAAGVATAAGAPLKFVSGTNLTSAEAGAAEYDGKAFYLTPTASSRAVVPVTHYSALTADFTGTNVNTAQPVFDTAQDVITLAAATTYEMEAVYHIHTTGTTSHQLGILFAGTATLTSIDYSVWVTNAATEVLGAVQALWVSVATVTNVTAATATATHHTVLIKGLVRINAGGTFIPQYQWSAAPGVAGVTLRNSFIKLTPIGSNTVAAVGAWA